MLDLKNGLDAFFHSLIPRNLRENTTVRDAEYIKVRALSVLLFFFLVFQVIEITGTILWHTIADIALLKHELVSIGIFVIYITQAIMFYRFGNQWMSALAFTATYFLIIVIIVVVSGGHHSPMKVLLLTCPFMAFLIGDKQEGIQTSLLVLVIGWVLALLDSIQFETPNLFAEADPAIVFAIDSTIALAVIILSITVYETALVKNETLHVNAIDDQAQKIKESRLKGFDSFLHKMVPPLLRATLPVNSMAYVRARFMSVTLLTIIIIETMTTLPAIFRFWIFNTDPSVMLVPHGSAIAILLLFSLQLWLFRRFGNYSLSSIIFTNSYFMIVVALVISSGGYDSPLNYLLLTCPLLTFVVRGINEGMQNSLYTLIAFTSLSAFNIVGFSFDDVMTSGTHPYLTFCSGWLIAIIIMTICIVVYETELQRQFKKA